MPFQVCIKTSKPLEKLAEEIRVALSLPPFKLDSFAEESYCQFDILGMLVLLRPIDGDERDPEVKNYAYGFSLQMSFTEHELDTDELEYQLQPYYAQLLAFHLDVETACYEKKRVGPHWQVRYCYYARNPKWDESILYGETGWEPAIVASAPSPWRSIRPLV